MVFCPVPAPFFFTEANEVNEEPKPMRTLNEEWKAYRDACYPQGCPGEQSKECHQAFMAGALVALNDMDQLAERPDAEAVAELDKLYQEASQFAKARVAQFDQEN